MGSRVLIISNANELVRVKPERVVYVKSDGNQAFSLQASKEALKQLKAYMESKAGKEEKL